MSNRVPRTRSFLCRILAVEGADPNTIALASDVSYEVAGVDPLTGSPYSGRPTVTRPYTGNVDVMVPEVGSLGTLVIDSDRTPGQVTTQVIYFMPHEEQVVYEECPVGSQSMTQRVLRIIRRAMDNPSPEA